MRKEYDTNKGKWDRRHHRKRKVGGYEKERSGKERQDTR